MLMYESDTFVECYAMLVYVGMYMNFIIFFLLKTIYDAAEIER